MAGHDFAHWRNWAEARYDKEMGHGAWRMGARKAGVKPIAPPYGVGQATQELFSQCTVHVRFNTWWVESSECAGPLPMVTASELR